MKIAIVEDDSIWRLEIKNHILEYLQREVEIITYDSGEKFLLENESFDIVFMDIELKEKSGFDTSVEYKKKYPGSILIIVTTHQEWCNKGYQVEAFRYIDKLKLEEMKEALDSACKKLQRNQKIKLHVVLQGEVLVAYRDILYFETNGHNIYVHTTKETLACKENITVLAKQLEDSGFYYIHRSFLVNMDYIITYNKKEAIISNRDVVLISLRKLRDFKTVYMKWKFEHGNG